MGSMMQRYWSQAPPFDMAHWERSYKITTYKQSIIHLCLSVRNLSISDWPKCTDATHC